MRVDKSKTYSFSLSQYKEHLSVFDNDHDNEIKSIVIDVISEIEKKCSIDIVPTVNTLEDYCIRGTCYRIYERDITINGITATTNLLSTPVVTTISASQYILVKGEQFTEIKFKSSITAEKLVIQYSSGFAAIPPNLNRAVKLRMSYLFDIDKNGVLSNGQTDSKAFDRLISPYMNLLY